MATAEAEDHLAWEAKQRNVAAIAALVGGMFTFVGALWRTFTLSDAPSVGVFDALTRAAEPGAVGQLESLRVTAYQYYDDQALSVLGSSVMAAIGYLGIGWALTYLAVATRARRPEFPRILLYLGLITGVLQGLSTLLTTVGTNIAISDFLSGPKTVEAADDIAGNGLSLFGQLLGLPGGLGLALALVFISLNAMRVGLLTRFMGTLGIICGVLLVMPLIAQPIVLCFWMLMLSVLFLARWPGGNPPAWRTGDAIPWPSSAQVREERQRAAAERRGESWDAPEPVAAGPSPATSSRKRKRKRR